MLLLSAFLVLAAAGPDLGPVPADTVRVYLVRHGQALSNLDPTPDLPPDQLDRLTDIGRAQSRRAASFLAGQGVVRVLSSPAGRARESAEEIARALGLAAPGVEPLLRPLDLGRAASGAPVTWDQRIAEWEAGRDPAPAGGESLEQMGRRVLDLVQSLRKGDAGRTVVVVAHSEVIGAFVGLLEGKPPAKRWPPKTANGSLTAVEAGPGPLPRLLFSNVSPPEPPSPAPR